jgi:trehalose utilization protein
MNRQNGRETMPVRVTIWNEFRHEKQNPAVGKLYPQGMHEAIATHLRKRDDLAVRTATLDEEQHGLTEQVLRETDVLTWWGHLHHEEVDDRVVERVHQRVLEGMGLLVLHSGHFSKLFKKLMGTTCNLIWRVAENEREILWVTRAGHPLVEGMPSHFVIDAEEMYGEFFDIPEPEQTVMISSFTGGEVFRSLCTWTRGAGKVVFFRPGHETFPTFYNPNVLRVIENSIRWAAPTPAVGPVTFGHRKSGWIDMKTG